MSPLAETRIIFLRELRKNFRSAKGIALAVLTLLGGAGVALIMAKVKAATGQGSGVGVPVQVLSLAYGPETAEWLSNAPAILFFMLNATIFLSPLLVALMGFDSVAGDVQYRSVRYWTVRSRRASFFVAKWLGLWITASAMTLAMDLIVWGVAIANRGETDTVSATLTWGLRFWALLVPICAVWSAISVVVSSLFRTPIVALLVTFATFFTLWVLSAVFVYFRIEQLAYLNPNQFDQLMLTPNVSRFLGGAAGALALAGVYVAGGSLVFARKDV